MISTKSSSPEIRGGSRETVEDPLDESLADLLFPHKKRTASGGGSGESENTREEEDAFIDESWLFEPISSESATYATSTSSTPTIPALVAAAASVAPPLLELTFDTTIVIEKARKRSMSVPTSLHTMFTSALKSPRMLSAIQKRDGFDAACALKMLRRGRAQRIRERQDFQRMTDTINGMTFHYDDAMEHFDFGIADMFERMARGEESDEESDATSKGILTDISANETVDEEDELNIESAVRAAYESYKAAGVTGITESTETDTVIPKETRVGPDEKLIDVYFMESVKRDVALHVTTDYARFVRDKNARVVETAFAAFIKAKNARVIDELMQTFEATHDVMRDSDRRRI